MNLSFKRPIRPRQMNLDTWAEAPAPRSRKKTGGPSEALMGGIQEDRLLTTREGARFLGFSPLTLKDWRKRSRRVGPTFIRVVRCVRYSLRHLRCYLKDRTVVPGEKK
jgi:hypothetical protein